MGNIVQSFAFKSLLVRVVIKGNKPWFVAKDLCDVLEIKNVSDALNKLDDDEKDSIALTDGTPGNPNKAIVSESGMYALILRSRKKEAKVFRKWVTSEVLTSISSTGSYSVKNKGQSHGTPLRLEGKNTRRLLTDAVKDYIDRHPELSINAKKWMYSNMTNGLYLRTHKLKANQIIEIYGCKKEELRDHFSPKEVGMINAVEFVTIQLIDTEDMNPIEAIHSVVERTLATHLFASVYAEAAMKLKASKQQEALQPAPSNEQ